MKSVQQAECELEQALRELSVAEDAKRRNEYASGRRDDWYGEKVSDCRASVSRARINLQSSKIIERQRHVVIAGTSK